MNNRMAIISKTAKNIIIDDFFIKTTSIDNIILSLVYPHLRTKLNKLKKIIKNNYKYIINILNLKNYSFKVKIVKKE